DDKSGRRTGLIVPLAVPIRMQQGIANAGDWISMPDGSRLRQLNLGSLDARGLRIRFSDLALPASVRLMAYDPGNTRDAHAIRTELTDLESGEYWSPTLFAEVVTLECYVPAGTQAAP